MKRNALTDTLDFYALARDYLHGYMPKVRALSPKTIEAYRISLECFITYLTSCEHVRRQDVTFDHFHRGKLNAWLTWMREDRQYAPKTVTLRLSAIKAFLTYAAQEDITLVAVSQAANGLKGPRTPKSPIEYLTPVQTRALLAAHTGNTMKSRRNRMLLIFLYDTAARVSELTSLTLEALSLEIPGKVTLIGKRNKTRIVPLTQQTIEHLRVYLDEFHPNRENLPAARPLFYSMHDGEPVKLSTDTVTVVLKQAGVIAQENCSSLPKRLYCHLLRKTKAMDLYQQGIPLPIIMRLLGHEHAATTSTFYAFATLDMMRKAIDSTTSGAATLPSGYLTEERLAELYSLK